MRFATLSSPKTLPTNIAHLAATVLHLEGQRLGNGHSTAPFFAANNVHFLTEKFAFQKSGHFRRNRTSSAAFRTFSDPKIKSARFVRMPQSQMKRKAFVTLSPLDQGLLLGRHAF